MPRLARAWPGPVPCVCPVWNLQLYYPPRRPGDLVHRCAYLMDHMIRVPSWLRCRWAWVFPGGERVQCVRFIGHLGPCRGPTGREF